MLPHQSQLRARGWDCEEVMHWTNLRKLLCSGRLYLPCIERERDLNKPNVLLSQWIWALPDCFDTCILCKVFAYLLFYESVMLHSAVLKKITFCILILCYRNKEVSVLSFVERVAGALSCAVLVCFGVKRASLRETCHGAEWQWIKNDEFLLSFQWS